MLRSIRKTNDELARTLVELRKAAKTHQAPLWRSVAEKLNRPRHAVRPINVGHLDRIVHPQETVVIPGKLLAEGRLSKPVTVAAYSYSESAREKIQAAGGTALTIHDLLKSKPSGAGVRLLA